MQKKSLKCSGSTLPVDVDVALIEERVEHVDCLDGRRSLLFEAKDEVNPLVQVLGYVIALEGGPMHSDKLAGVVLGPGRQKDVTERYTALFHAQIELVVVCQDFRQVEEFGYQFLDVGHVVLGG